MNAPGITDPSLFQTHFDRDQTSTSEPFISEVFISEPTTPEPTFVPIPFYEAFALRAAQVEGLIDEKMGYITESARLRSLAKSDPRQRKACSPLIRDLEETISRLQEQIDREMKGLFYSLQKAPAPSPFLDNLPG